MVYLALNFDLDGYMDAKGSVGSLYHTSNTFFETEKNNQEGMLMEDGGADTSQGVKFGVKFKADTMIEQCRKAEPSILAVTYTHIYDQELRHMNTLVCMLTRIADRKRTLNPSDNTNFHPRLLSCFLEVCVVYPQCLFWALLYALQYRVVLRIPAVLFQGAITGYKRLMRRKRS